MPKLNDQEQKYLTLKEDNLREFIDKHPEAAELQKKLDAKLIGCNQAERLEIIFMMLTGKFKELSDQCSKLSDNYQKYYI